MPQTLFIRFISHSSHSFIVLCVWCALQKQADKQRNIDERVLRWICIHAKDIYYTCIIWEIHKQHKEMNVNILLIILVICYYYYYKCSKHMNIDDWRVCLCVCACAVDTSFLLYSSLINAIWLQNIWIKHIHYINRQTRAPLMYSAHKFCINIKFKIGLENIHTASQKFSQLFNLNIISIISIISIIISKCIIIIIIMKVCLTDANLLFIKSY